MPAPTPTWFPGSYYEPRAGGWLPGPSPYLPGGPAPEAQSAQGALGLPDWGGPGEPPPGWGPDTSVPPVTPGTGWDPLTQGNPYLPTGINPTTSPGLPDIPNTGAGDFNEKNPDFARMNQGPDAVWDDWISRMGPNLARQPGSRPGFSQSGWGWGGFGSTAATPTDQLDYSPEGGQQKYNSPLNKQRWGRASFGQLATL